MEGDLFRSWKRLKKKNGPDDRDSIEAGLRELMIRYAPVPKEMAEELADFYLTVPIDEESVYRSDEILELLHGTWSDGGSVLDGEDWDFLKDQVNAWATELDMDVVTDVMRIIVERGGFDGD